MATDQTGDTERVNSSIDASRDGAASIAILILTVVLIVFLITRIV